MIKKAIKSVIGDNGASLIRRIVDSMNPALMLRRLRCAVTWRGKAARLEAERGGLRLHLGCGNKKYPGMLNCEIRATQAADIVMDCGSLRRFRDKSASMIFSHAFFEHLYKKQQLPLLKDIHRVLKDYGVVLFIGIPDFEVISRAYLDKAPGIKSETFDLYHVYRYSHGDPEIASDYWLAQLHKSLFDRESIVALLRSVGFGSICYFNYCYPNESIPLNAGFAATKSDDIESIRLSMISLLTPFKDNMKNIDEAIESAVYFKL